MIKFSWKPNMGIRIPKVHRNLKVPTPKTELQRQEGIKKDLGKEMKLRMLAPKEKWKRLSQFFKKM